MRLLCVCFTHLPHRIADKGGSVQVCDLNSQTNALSNCIQSTLTGFAGTLSPTGVVVKGSVAWVANDDAACGVVYCSDAATMTGCSCVSSTMAASLGNVTGISFSPAKDKLYVVGVVSGAGNASIIACNINSTTIVGCTTYQLSYSGLTGMAATDIKLYMYLSDGAATLTSHMLICDVTNPASCFTNTVITGSGLASLGLVGLTRNGPWGLSIFDGKMYVPDNWKYFVCTSSCGTFDLRGALGATTSTAGALSFFTYPRL